MRRALIYESDSAAHKSVTITGFVKNVEMLLFLPETLILREPSTPTSIRPHCPPQLDIPFRLFSLLIIGDILYISFQLRSAPLSPYLVSFLVRRIRYCVFLCFFRAANPLFSKNFLSMLSPSPHCLTITQSISCRRRPLHNNQWFHPIRRKIRSSPWH